MTAPKDSVSNAVIIDRVDLVLKRLDSIDKKMDDADKERSTFRENYAKEHAILDAKATSAHDRITIHVSAEDKKWTRVDDIEKWVLELRHTNRIVLWAATVIVGAVLLWMVGKFLGLL